MELQLLMVLPLEFETAVDCLFSAGASLDSLVLTAFFLSTASFVCSTSNSFIHLKSNQQLSSALMMGLAKL